MTTKHAPGPWFIWAGGVYAGRPEVKKPEELRGYDAKICEIDDMDGTVRSRKANARLIAAAPDLLEALQEMVAGDAEAIEDAKRLGVPFPDEMLAAYHKARAAIARATGEQP